MAVKHNNQTRIGDGREGIFEAVTPGAFQSLPTEFPPAAEGKLFWHVEWEIMYIYLGGAWKRLT